MCRSLFVGDLMCTRPGRVTERPNVPVLKTGEVRASVGSNPTSSAEQSALRSTGGALSRLRHELVLPMLYT